MLLFAFFKRWLFISHVLKLEKFFLYNIHYFFAQPYGWRLFSSLHETMRQRKRTRKLCCAKCLGIARVKGTTPAASLICVLLLDSRDLVVDGNQITQVTAVEWVPVPHVTSRHPHYLRGANAHCLDERCENRKQYYNACEKYSVKIYSVIPQAIFFWMDSEYFVSYCKNKEGLAFCPTMSYVNNALAFWLCSLQAKLSHILLLFIRSFKK